MQADSVDFVYNHIIAENIAGNTKNKAYKFVLANENSIPADFFEEVKINENEEECSSDLSSVPMEEMREILGVDSLGFLSLDGVKKIAEGCQLGLCTGCFCGDYPAETPAVTEKSKFEKKLSESID